MERAKRISGKPRVILRYETKKEDFKFATKGPSSNYETTRQHQNSPLAHPRFLLDPTSASSKPAPSRAAKVIITAGFDYKILLTFTNPTLLCLSLQFEIRTNDSLSLLRLSLVPRDSLSHWVSFFFFSNLLHFESQIRYLILLCLALITWVFFIFSLLHYDTFLGFLNHIFLSVLRRFLVECL